MMADVAQMQDDAFKRDSAAAAAASSAGAGGSSALQARPVGMQSNACAAATAALLGLAAQSPQMRRRVMQELGLQVGARMRMMVALSENPEHPGLILDCHLTV